MRLQSRLGQLGKTLVLVVESAGGIGNALSKQQQPEADVAVAMFGAARTVVGRVHRGVGL